MLKLIICIPKSGTNLLTGAFQGPHLNLPYGVNVLDSQPHKLFIKDLPKITTFGRTHIAYHPAYEQEFKEHDVKALFLYRDPRDIMVSHYHWTKKTGNNIPFYAPVWMTEIVKSPDPYMEMLEWYDMHIRRYIPWLTVPNVMSITYEDLVSSYRKQVFEKILEFFGSPPGSSTTADEMIRGADRRDNFIFRKGAVGDWKGEFSDRHIEVFWNKFEKIMEILGYDKEETAQEKASKGAEVIGYYYSS